MLNTSEVNQRLADVEAVLHERARQLELAYELHGRRRTGIRLSTK